MTGPESQAARRTANYAAVGGTPRFSRALIKQTRAWVKRRERERAKQQAESERKR